MAGFYSIHIKTRRSRYRALGTAVEPKRNAGTGALQPSKTEGGKLQQGSIKHILPRRRISEATVSLILVEIYFVADYASSTTARAHQGTFMPIFHKAEASDLSIVSSP